MNKKIKFLSYVLVFVLAVPLFGLNISASDEGRVTVSKKIVAYEIPVDPLGDYETPKESQEIIIRQTSGDDIGEISFIIEESMKDYFTVTCEDNNLGVDKPVTIQVNLTNAKRKSLYKVIENGLQIMSGDEVLAKVGLFYAINVTPDLHAANYPEYWSGEILDEDGTRYAITATINLDSLDLNIEYPMSFIIGYFEDKEGNMHLNDDIASLALNPDDIYIFDDGTYKKNITISEGQQFLDFKLKIKESGYQEFIDSYNRHEIQAFDQYALLSSLVINYADGCSCGGNSTSLPVVIHTIFKDKITLDHQQLELLPAQEVTLQATSLGSALTWSSSDERIASVDQFGKVTAHQAGEADIMVTNINGNSDTCKVTVGQQPIVIEKTESFDQPQNKVDKKVQAPDTGDASNVMGLLILFLFSLIGIKKIVEKEIIL